MKEIKVVVGRALMCFGLLSAFYGLKLLSDPSDKPVVILGVSSEGSNDAIWYKLAPLGIGLGMFGQGLRMVNE